jgi:predicted phosphodiesterase
LEKHKSLVLALGGEVQRGETTWRKAAEKFTERTGEKMTRDRLRGRYRWYTGSIPPWKERKKKEKPKPSKEPSGADRIQGLINDRKQLLTQSTELQREIDKLKEDNAILTRQMDMLRSQLRKVPIDFGGEQVRFGVLSDSHMGSLYENMELLHAAYDMFSKEGITRVFNCGDICEGHYTSKRSQHQFEVRVHGYDKQAEYVIDNYPRADGITTELITGNHDATFYKSVGADIGKYIAGVRDDINYHGNMESDVEIKTDNGSAIVRMFHPDGGTAYAMSYKFQKIVESMSGGHKPNVLLLGHYHKSEYAFYMNVHVIQAGTTQHQTPFMRGKHMPAHMGFWIVELTVNQAGVARCQPLWFPDYA